jgi:hypothetical protein
MCSLQKPIDRNSLSCGDPNEKPSMSIAALTKLPELLAEDCSLLTGHIQAKQLDDGIAGTLVLIGQRDIIGATTIRRCESRRNAEDSFRLCVQLD